MSRNTIVFAAFLVILLALTLMYSFVWNRSSASRDRIEVSGNIEVTDADVGFKIDGRVARRLVDEGEQVTIGQTIALLDPSDLLAEVAIRKAEVAEAEAELSELEAGSRPQEIAAAKAVFEKARATLDELEAGSRPQEIAAAKATLDSALADREFLEGDYQRLKALYERKSLTKEEYERARSAFQMAAAKAEAAARQYDLVKEGPRQEQIAQARAALAEARAQYELVREGPRKEKIRQSQAKLERAKSSLGLAEIRLDDATLRSPLSGIVLSKNIEPGEYVAQGTPIVTVGDLANVWLRAYIDETDLGRVKVGQKVRITTDTYPGKVYEGRISFLASQAEFTPKNVQTPKERVKLVYRIKVEIANPKMELKPGMPADAEILLDSPR